MDIVPLRPVPAQTQRTVLGSQDVTITVYERRGYDGHAAYPLVYVDLTLNGVDVISGIPARNRVKLIRDSYRGFIGDLAFVDTLGDQDPVSNGLGTRWLLVYLSESDL